MSESTQGALNLPNSRNVRSSLFDSAKLENVSNSRSVSPSVSSEWSYEIFSCVSGCLINVKEVVT